MKIYKKSSAIQTIKKMFLKKSQVEQYLPLLKQQLHQKIQRIYQDKSYKFEEDISNKKMASLKFIKTILLGHKISFEPLIFKMLVWYVAVILSIFFMYFQATLVLTYGVIVEQQLYSSVFFFIFKIIWILVLVVDVYIQLNTAYLLNGMVVRQKSRILRRYLINFSLIDLTTIIIYFVSFGIVGTVISYLKLIIVLKFYRILEIDKFFLRKLSRKRKMKTVYILFKQMVIIIFMSHTIALGFYTIDYSLLNTLCAGENSQLCWLNQSTSWSPIIGLDWQLQYFYSLYWGVNDISTIDYGDIISGNPIQVIYQLFMMCLGFFTYGYITNNIIQALLWARGPSDALKNQFRTIEVYMEGMGIDKSLKSQVKNYIEFLHVEQKNRNIELQAQMMTQLPEDLKYQLVRSAYSQLMKKFKGLFQESNEITSFLYFIQEKKHTTGDLIFSQGNIVDKICYLHKGEVMLQCEYGESQHQLSSQNTANEFFLLYEYIVNEESKISVKSLKQSVFYFVSRQNIQQCILKSMDLREIFQMLKNEVFVLGRLKRIQAYCYFCYSQQHHWYKCSKHFTVFPDVKIKQSNFDKQKYKRKIPQRHNVLHDKHRLEQIQQLAFLRSNSLYNKIQNRLHELRQQIQKSKHSFQVDLVHQWRIYYPEMNIIKIKELFNKKNLKKIEQERIFRLSHFVKL